MDEFLWVEKYRPKTVKDCILPDRLKKLFQQYADSKSIPNLILCGTAGVGKTTVALAMCDEIGASHMKINASKERGIDILRTKIEQYAGTVSLSGSRKVMILDEADNLTHDAQKALLGVIEECSANCTFILTCNFKSRLLDAVQSRCPSIDFTLQADERPRMASQFLKRMEEILKKENVVYERPVLIKIVEKYLPDYRRLLGELQRHGTAGAINAGTLAEISALRNFEYLAAHLKDKDFGEMRKWVVANSDVDVSMVFRRVYDALMGFMTPQDVPQAVVILAKYQYQSAFVADQEINLVACLTELMVSCEFQ